MWYFKTISNNYFKMYIVKNNFFSSEWNKDICNLWFFGPKTSSKDLCHYCWSNFTLYKRQNWIMGVHFFRASHCLSQKQFPHTCISFHVILRDTFGSVVLMLSIRSWFVGLQAELHWHNDFFPLVTRVYTSTFSISFFTYEN